ncbi:hypothetical protein BT96DRAFT_809079 [Gymnopus androsaceus JB14]|uniref:Uncharacterized protein n=1 Tax=Gymnopus androsaceus JB14 TaxID=1447944 RepID=A0A6A4IEV0_9AGAR|nr:hypothetical protein BT96DRAFT_809079 [Gymnopus androsaceus JB14]
MPTDITLPQAPAGSLDYVNKVLEICRVKTLDLEWANVVQLWFNLDAKNSFEAKDGKLGTGNQPGAVQGWIVCARNAKWRPTKLDVAKFLEEFKRWWHGLQPEGREQKPDCFIMLLKVEGVKWGSLRARRTDGIASIVAALALWHEGIIAMPHLKLREMQA